MRMSNPIGSICHRYAIERRRLRVVPGKGVALSSGQLEG